MIGKSVNLFPLPVTSFVVCSLICLNSKVHFIARDLRGGVHSVCFHDKIKSEIHLNIETYLKSRQHVKDKNICGINVNIGTTLF